MSTAETGGLVLHPFRALRPRVDRERLGRLLCPPYDVIDDQARARLLAGDPDNAVALILPGEPSQPGADRYTDAARRLESWVAAGLLAVDDQAALYVYEMSDGAGATTRGLLGAVDLRDPDDGVILPHENTMAGPVADRYALMTACDANLEPIYLVYDGGGAASAAVREVDASAPVAEAVTPDGLTHRLWAITDHDILSAVATDLSGRRALIADGHHRYATYRQVQQTYRAERGPGPWDRGLTLLVDSSTYGPQVHAIHRTVSGMSLDSARARLEGSAEISEVESPAAGLARAELVDGFAVVLTDGSATVVVTDPHGALRDSARREGEPAAVADLDVSVLHRGMVERVWGLPDTVDVVGYAHTVDEALAAARDSGGFAVLLRPTPVDAVTAVAAAGARMPRKSTFFTPKPASGLVMRRFADER